MKLLCVVILIVVGSSYIMQCIRIYQLPRPTEIPVTMHPNLEIVFSPERMEVSILKFLVQIEPDRTATISVLFVFKSNDPNAMTSLEAMVLAPRSLKSGDVFPRNDSSFECIEFVVKNESSRHYNRGPVESVSVDSYLVNGTPTGREDDYQYRAVYSLKLGRNIENSLRSFNLPGWVRDDTSVSIVAIAEFNVKTTWAVQQRENTCFSDVRLRVRSQTDSDFQLYVPFDAEIIFSSSNLVRVRPYALLGTVSASKMDYASGRFYVQYEIIPLYLRFPYRDLIFGVVLGSLSGVILAEVLRLLARILPARISHLKWRFIIFGNRLLHGVRTQAERMKRSVCVPAEAHTQNSSQRRNDGTTTVQILSAR